MYVNFKTNFNLMQNYYWWAPVERNMIAFWCMSIKSRANLVNNRWPRRMLTQAHHWVTDRLSVFLNNLDMLSYQMACFDEPDKF